MFSSIKLSSALAFLMMGTLLGAVSMAQAAPVPLTDPTATFCQTTGGSYPVSESIDGSLFSLDGWAIDPQEGSNKTAVYKTADDLGSGGSTGLTIQLYFLFPIQHELGRFRLAATSSDRSLFGQGSECADANPGGTAVWTILEPESVVSANGQTLSVQPDGSILASGARPDTDIVTFRTMVPLAGITGFRLEALADGSLPSGGPGRYPSNGNFVLTEITVATINEPAPTLGAWAAALTMLLLLSAGTLVLRRRAKLAPHTI